MAEFDRSTVAEALEVSIAAATHLTPEHAAAVATARRLAERMDVLSASGWLDPASGKLDNVTFPSFIKYLDALGLVMRAEKAKPGPASSASPTQQALNDMRKGLTLVPEVG